MANKKSKKTETKNNENSRLSAMGKQFLYLFTDIEKKAKEEGKDWKFYFNVKRGVPMNYFHRKPFERSNVMACMLCGAVYTITKTQLTKIRDEVVGLRGLPVENFKNDTERERVEAVRKMAYKKFEEEGGKLPKAKLYPMFNPDGSPKLDKYGKQEMCYHRVPIVCCFPYEKKDRKTKEPILDKDGNPVIDFGWTLHWEWDVHEIENYDFHIPEEEYQPKEFISHEKAEAMISQMIARTGVNVHYDNPLGQPSFFRPSDDSIHLCERKYYDTLPYYFYSVFSHEFGHSTGIEKRLNRPGIVKCVGSTRSIETYAEEELVAQFFAIIIMKLVFGINDTYDNDVKYIASWWEELKNDPDKFAWAFTNAYKAYDWLMILLGEKEEKDAA